MPSDFCPHGFLEHDWKVFNSFDYKKYKPKVVITEYNARNFDNDYRVYDSLIKSGEYLLGHKTEVYFVLVHKDVKYKNEE